MLLSEYENTIQEDAWWFIAIIVIVVVVVVIVVVETAEQIRANSNKTYNESLESSGTGVTKGNYITNQLNTLTTGYKSGNYRFGFTTFSGVGCEVASAYNLLISLGKSEMLSQTIYDFEKLCIEIAIGFGNLGSNPSEIYRFLNAKGISYSKYTNETSFNNAVASKSSCKIIKSTWNSSWTSGLHTYYINKINSSIFRTYNLSPKSSEWDLSSMDLCTTGGSFIVGYIIY